MPAFSENPPLGQTLRRIRSQPNCPPGHDALHIVVTSKRLLGARRSPPCRPRLGTILASLSPPGRIDPSGFAYPRVGKCSQNARCVRRTTTVKRRRRKADPPLGFAHANRVAGDKAGGDSVRDWQVNFHLAIGLLRRSINGPIFRYGAGSDRMWSAGAPDESNVFRASAQTVAVDPHNSPPEIYAEYHIHGISSLMQIPPLPPRTDDKMG